MRVINSGESDVGCVRTNNEDTLLVDEELGLYMVADGMGGAEGGEIASRMAADIVQREVRARLPKIRENLQKASPEGRAAASTEVGQCIVTASKEIFARAKADEKLRGMGTTAALVVVVDDQAIIAHVGDSRVYQIRGGQCVQLTEDHSLLAEHLKHGLISAEEAKKAKWGNVLSRSVGTHMSVKADTLHVEMMVGDEFVICSDGLHGYLTDGELAKVAVGTTSMSLVMRLVDLARERGGHDNITVIDVRVEEPPPAVVEEPPAAEAPAETSSQAAPVAPAPPPAPPPAVHSPSDKMMALKAIPLFSQLDYKELVQVLTILSMRTHAAGQEVFAEGAEGDEMFVLMSGKVEVKTRGMVLATLRPLMHFGEMALADKSPRSATVTALEASKLMVIRRDDFLGLAHREPVMGMKMTWALVGVLSQRLRETFAQVFRNEKRDS